MQYIFKVVADTNLNNSVVCMDHTFYFRFRSPKFLTLITFYNINTYSKL